MSPRSELRPAADHAPVDARANWGTILRGIRRAALLAGVWAAFGSIARADSNTRVEESKSASKPTVALSVGDTQISVDEVLAWVTALAPADLPRSGNAAKRAREVLERHFVPEALLTEHARRRLGDAPAMRSARDVALVDALERHLAESIEIDPSQIAAFYAANAGRYQQPEAIYLWRILVASEQDANEIIAKVKDKRLGVYEWGNLARERSLDEATKHRDGSLGFVRADGTTDVPQVRVNPALFAAAHDLPDGTLVPTPIAEGNQFAVVWRRGTRPAVEQSLQEQTPHIRSILARAELQKSRAALVAQLRAQYVSDVSVTALESVEYTLTAATAVPRTRPALTAKGTSNPTPKPGDRGDR